MTTRGAESVRDQVDKEIKTVRQQFEVDVAALRLEIQNELKIKESKEIDRFEKLRLDWKEKNEVQQAATGEIHSKLDELTEIFSSFKNQFNSQEERMIKIEDRMFKQDERYAGQEERLQVTFNRIFEGMNRKDQILTALEKCNYAFGNGGGGYKYDGQSRESEVEEIIEAFDRRWEKIREASDRRWAEIREASNRELDELIARLALEEEMEESHKSGAKDSKEAMASCANSSVVNSGEAEYEEFPVQIPTLVIADLSPPPGNNVLTSLDNPEVLVEPMMKIEPGINSSCDIHINCIDKWNYVGSVKYLGESCMTGNTRVSLCGVGCDYSLSKSVIDMNDNTGIRTESSMCYDPGISEEKILESDGVGFVDTYIECLIGSCFSEVDDDVDRSFAEHRIKMESGCNFACVNNLELFDIKWKPVPVEYVKEDGGILKLMVGKYKLLMGIRKMCEFGKFQIKDNELFHDNKAFVEPLLCYDPGIAKILHRGFVGVGCLMEKSASFVIIVEEAFERNGKSVSGTSKDYMIPDEDDHMMFYWYVECSCCCSDGYCKFCTVLINGQYFSSTSAYYSVISAYCSVMKLELQLQINSLNQCHFGRLGCLQYLNQYGRHLWKVLVCFRPGNKNVQHGSKMFCCVCNGDIDSILKILKLGIVWRNNLRLDNDGGSLKYFGAMCIFSRKSIGAQGMVNFCDQHEKDSSSGISWGDQGHKSSTCDFNKNGFPGCMICVETSLDGDESSINMDFKLDESDKSEVSETIGSKGIHMMVGIMQQRFFRNLMNLFWKFFALERKKLNQMSMQKKGCELTNKTNNFYEIFKMRRGSTEKGTMSWLVVSWTQVEMFFWSLFLENAALGDIVIAGFGYTNINHGCIRKLLDIAINVKIARIVHIPMAAGNQDNMQSFNSSANTFTTRRTTKTWNIRATTFKGSTGRKHPSRYNHLLYFFEVFFKALTLEVAYAVNYKRLHIMAWIRAWKWSVLGVYLLKMIREGAWDNHYFYLQFFLQLLQFSFEVQELEDKLIFRGRVCHEPKIGPGVKQSMRLLIGKVERGKKGAGGCGFCGS